MMAQWPNALLASPLLVIAGIVVPTQSDAASSPFEQVRHASWHSQDDAPTNIQGLAQAPDGFLWIASATGLYRFDGLTFEHIPLEGGDGTQSLQIASIAAAPNGDIWVGYNWGGMARYSRGRLRPANPGTPSRSPVYLAVTKDGSLWARAPGSKGSQLIRFRDGRWTDIDASWGLPPRTNSSAMLVARDGTFYLVNPDGVRRLKPGARRFEFQPMDTGKWPTIAEDRRGRIWLADTTRLFRLQFGEGQVGPVTPLPPSDLYRRLVFDAEGAAWLGGAEDGVRRLLPDASGDRFLPDRGLFGEADGLTSGVSLTLMQDSEHNIWAGTLLGLDRFSIRRAIRHAGLPLSYAFDTFKAADGEAYIAINHGLYRIGRSGPEKLADIPSVETICGDRDGIVVATQFELFSYAEGKLRTIPTPGLGNDRAAGIRACGFDAKGQLLLSVAHRPLYRLDRGGWRAIAPILPTAPEGAYALLPASQADMILIYPKDRIVRLGGDGPQTLWTANQGNLGFLRTTAAGAKCTLYGAQNGLGCLVGKEMRILSSATYPQLTNVSGIVRNSDGWTWLIAMPGIMRVRSVDLDAAFATPGRPLHFERFGAEEGLRGESMLMHPHNAIADRFGRLWFYTIKGLVSLDIAGIDASPPPPRVVVKSLTSNGRHYAASGPVLLPVGTRSFQIDYTATTLTDPGGTSFRYRLDGVDSSWNDAGGRRQAFYTNLAPGQYRFRLSAVSSAGVPSNGDAVIDIRIEPSFTQTRTFAIVCILGLLLLATLLYRWRVHSLSARLSERLQERLDERERIARELHDTLLQGVSGLLLRFQSLAARVPSHEPLRGDMEAALDQAEDLVVEGRNRVRNLRAGDQPRDLEETLALALTQPGLNRTVEVHMERSGAARAVTGVAAEELAAIASEVLGNAARHGNAKSINVRMSFDAKQLEVQFDDDGTGIPEEIVAAGSRPGHFGLIGMRERAERLRGKLLIGQAPTGGARIRVSIPQRAAYPVRPGLFQSIASVFRRPAG